MTTLTLRTLAVLISTSAAMGLGACTVYDTSPSYPSGYYFSEPAYPRYYSGPSFYLGFGDGHYRRGDHHHRRYGWH
jgi:hypothetical protein